MERATRILINGKIFTADEKNPWAQAVVIKGNKIAYVGANEAALKFAANSAQVQDLGGKLATPGLIDGHMHFFGATVFEGLAQLSGLNPEEMLKAVKAYVEERPERAAYAGEGWLDNAFGEVGPNKKDLDAICPDKPVALFSASMHTLWCNSKALEIANITRNTPDVDPQGGVVFQRDENGEPTGYAKELGSINQIMRCANYFDDSLLDKTFKNFMAKCAGFGITSVVDCGALSFMKSLMNDKLNAAFDKNKTPIRLNFCGYAGASGLYEAAFNDTLDLSGKYNNDRFFCSFHKLFNDGTVESASAALPNAYPSGNIIKPNMTAETLAEKFERCAKAGLDVNVHAIGSNAVRNVLLAAGIVREKGYKDIRIICSHSSYVFPEDVALFGKNDVFSDTTGCWISAADEETDEFISKLADARAYPVKSIMTGGATVGFGSDFPTDPASLPPMKSIECLVTRQAVGQKDGFVHDGAERLSIEEVIKGYTINNAYQMRKEDVLGSIEVGKYADITIFEQNLFEIEPHEIHNVKVAETIKDGLTTYKS